MPPAARPPLPPSVPTLTPACPCPCPPTHPLPLPRSLTYSLHYLAEPAFAQVVGRYLGQERAEMEYTLRVLQAEASPYRQ